MKNISENKLLRGFSLVEVLLAVSLFALGITAMVGAMIYGQESVALSGSRARASYLANEGVEALKNISDSGFTNVAVGTYGLAVSGNQWTLSENPDVTDLFFTRQVDISTVDSNTKRATVSVAWQQNLQRSGSIIMDTYLTNWRAPIGMPPASMMVYSKSTNVPYYRIWNTSNSSWGGENAATSVATGSNIEYLVVKYSHTRDEAILGTLDSTGDIRVQIWDGSSWGEATLLANIGTTNDAYRSFDIEYETNGNRTVVVYNNANSADPAYKIWDGNSWSSAVSITAPPTTGAPLWIELASNPGSASNEIAMVFLDANSDVYGMAWNGSSWGTMGAGTVWDSSAATSARKAIGVAYEQSSGQAMFIWGDSVSTDQYYRTWNGSTLAGPVLLDISTMGGVANWVSLISRPDSDELMYGVQDAGSDLNTRIWDGDSWNTLTQNPEHSSATENITSKNFDIVYETLSANLGKAWLIWGDGKTISRKQWSGSAWGNATTLTGSDDTAYVELNAKPNTGEILTGAYESSTSASDDILEWHLDGGSSTWSGKGTIWGGPISSEPVMFRIDIESR